MNNEIVIIVLVFICSLLIIALCSLSVKVNGLEEKNYTCYEELSQCEMDLDECIASMR